MFKGSIDVLGIFCCWMCMACVISPIVCLERFKESDRAQLIQDHLASIAQKTCLVGLKGVECLKKTSSLRNNVLLRSSTKSTTGNTNQGNTTPSSTLALLYAGVGYDAWTHSVKPPILQTSLAVESQGRELISGHFSTANEFYSMIYPMNGQSTFYNGLYTHNGNINEVFNQFFIGNFSAIDVQLQITTHQVASINQLTNDFQYLIGLLPDQYDSDIYNRVIEFFGDSIATNVKYGGIVDLTVSIRSCFSDPNMESYVKNELNTIISNSNNNEVTNSIPIGYVRYHKVSQLDIAGGNPELSNIKDRISTFNLNPVPIKVTSIPIWQAFPEGTKKKNMKLAYDNYIQSKKVNVESMIDQLKKKSLESQQPFYAFGKTRSNLIIDLGKGVINTGETVSFSQLRYKVLNFANNIITGQDCYGIARINRNLNTFNMDLLQECNINGKLNNFGTVSSKYVNNDCAVLKMPSGGDWRITYYDVTEIYVCSGCQPFITSDGKQLSCNCPYA